MKKVLFATLLGLMALTGAEAFGGLFFNRCCEEKKIQKCPPAPCCVTTVEVRKPAKKIVECDCRWECPTDCETRSSSYVINSGGDY
ncbi:MAG TPA: hypothetical protein VHA52_08875 [Candidatus Babeliaceae bacterium]|nr:hypothetical protein [Candidatus Babeliaceae bacterium]